MDINQYTFIALGTTGYIIGFLFTMFLLVLYVKKTNHPKGHIYDFDKTVIVCFSIVWPLTLIIVVVGVLFRTLINLMDRITS